MPRASSPWILGDYWLDKRRDGKSPDIWQIAYLNPSNNSVTYRSTRERDLDRAKTVLERYSANRKVGRSSIHPTPPPLERPDPMAIPVIPQLYAYWDEQGSQAVTHDSILPHLKKFKAFLEADKLGPNATFDNMGKAVVERYRKWMMAPHSCAGEWRGSEYRLSSKYGVCGATFRRSFASVKAALNLAYENGVVPHPCNLPSLPTEFKSPPRTRVLTAEEIGAMLGYAKGDEALLNWILIMLATGVRPVAATLMVPSQQWDEQAARLNLHPKGARRTKKRNPRVPVIPPLLELLKVHDGAWIPERVRYHSLTRRWRIMREALGFAEEVVPKTLRHTVATELWNARVSDLDISMLLGHVEFPTWQAQPAQSPQFYESIVPPLLRLWNDAHDWAERWRNEYTVVATARGGRVVVLQATIKRVDFDVTRINALATASARQMREARAKPNLYNGHGCLSRERRA